MGLEQQIRLSCDICEFPSKEFESQEVATQEGWLRLLTDKYYADRESKTTWICPGCAQRIVALHAQSVFKKEQR